MFIAIICLDHYMIQKNKMRTDGDATHGKTRDLK